MQLTGFDDLPVSSGKLVSGSDLLTVINVVIDPALEASLCFSIGRVTSLQPLTTAFRRRGQVLQLSSCYAIGSYAPAVGDFVVTIASSEHAILLGLAP